MPGLGAGLAHARAPAAAQGPGAGRPGGRLARGQRLCVGCALVARVLCLVPFGVVRLAGASRLAGCTGPWRPSAGAGPAAFNAMLNANFIFRLTFVKRRTPEREQLGWPGAGRPPRSTGAGAAEK